MQKTSAVARPKKILFISHSPALAGAERCLLDIITRLDRTCYEAILILPGEGLFLSAAREFGIRTEIVSLAWWLDNSNMGPTLLPWFLKHLWRGIAAVRRIIQNEKIDLVYTNTVTCIDAAIAAKLERVPHIGHIHETIKTMRYRSYLPFVPVSKIIDMLSTRIITCSQHAADELGVVSGKVEVVLNGIDMGKIPLHPDCSLLKNELGLKPTTKLVGLIGSLSERKGQIDFIKAAKIVCETSGDVKFVMVGSGTDNYRNLLQDLINTYNLGRSVILYGYHGDVPKILPSFDIIVSAARAESFGLTVLEGMAAARPVISTRCGGPEEILTDGETGLLVPVGEPAALAGAIIRLLLDDELCRNMGALARERAEECFGIELFFGKIMRVIVETANPSCPPLR